MHIHLIAIGTRMPAWVSDGFREYAKRLPAQCALDLQEIAAPKRGKTMDGPIATRREGERLLAAVPKGAQIVALDRAGELWSTEQLAARMREWMAGGLNPVLLVGGADGLAPACLEAAERCWSLSPLTFPHALVRVIVAEQIYRAWSLIQQLPYHR